MNKFDIEVISDLTLTRQTKRTLKITRKNKKMDIDDIIEINNMISDKVKNGEYTMRLFGIGTTPFTVKAWNGDFNLEDMEEYTEGQVRDNTKFSDEFFQIQITYMMKNK